MCAGVGWGGVKGIRVVKCEYERGALESLLYTGLAHPRYATEYEPQARGLKFQVSIVGPPITSFNTLNRVYN